MNSMEMTTEIKYGFGSHMMLDCYGCPKDKLSDLDLIYSALDSLPARIGLTKMMPPHVFKYSGQAPEDWGVSGVVLIAESHISIHTFPEKAHAFIDIFSCQEFDTDFARRQLLETFGATGHEVVLVDREWPRLYH
jgi:S-adenosylmethionine decarboxylase